MSALRGKYLHKQYGFAAGYTGVVIALWHPGDGYSASRVHVRYLRVFDSLKAIGRGVGG
jgi:hypothetical protein